MSDQEIITSLVSVFTKAKGSNFISLKFWYKQGDLKFFMCNNEPQSKIGQGPEWNNSTLCEKSTASPSPAPQTPTQARRTREYVHKSGGHFDFPCDR